MRFIKTFESFDPASGGNNAEKKIADKVNSMSADELAKANDALASLAKNLKLSVEDLQDAEKVEAALKTNVPELSESDLNEGLSEWWSRVKGKATSWMNKLGITGILASIAAMGIGAEMMDPASEFSGATVTPSTTVLIGAAALVISIAATLITNKAGKAATA